MSTRMQLVSSETHRTKALWQGYHPILHRRGLCGATHELNSLLTGVKRRSAERPARGPLWSGTTSERFPPPAVVSVPLGGELEALFEIALGGPAEATDLGAIDGVPT